MRKFMVLLGKELRELLTPQVLVPFVVIVAMFSLIGNIVGGEAEKAMGARSVGVMDLDGSAASAAVVGALEAAGYTPRALPADAGDRVVEALPRDARLAVVIPEGFGAGLAAGEQQRVESYAVLRDFSMAATMGGRELAAVLDAVNAFASGQLLAAAAPDANAEAVRRPVVLGEHVVVGDRTAEASVEEVVGFIGSQTTFIPIVLFMVIIFAAQMIATTIATEKENKTLETLLSVPVSRVAIVTAKMVAAGLVALLSAVVYLFGMRSYMQGITGMDLGEASPGALADLGLTLGGGDYVLLGLSLFFGILAALGIAVILGAFAENVKAVQSLLAPLMILIMVPYFLTLFIDVGSASPALRWGLYAIPFSHPFMAAPNLFLDRTGPVVAGIAYQAAWFGAFTMAAGAIFSSDRILTMKLRLGRRR
ncbi:MAG: ABC transporter permease [Coriobacteriia bacterium]|nr:ABC transporter permease [Coriobacteriia bacterium]